MVPGRSIRTPSRKLHLGTESLHLLEPTFLPLAIRESSPAHRTRMARRASHAMSEPDDDDGHTTGVVS